ncbi:MAG: ATP-binding cassette domain-containing protein [Deltaproteobacteria bacterium]|nr:ATP-binding cassette domain-containing protein [Deltaproteobacteria bacterium]MBW2053160.1 ATP-binding cassette domain-containing protein [Deltaproteobacteria bacterium]MBW2141661.1 ATP-binding cassette domain-containing protein [Deltaproteobacteria bacterium]MBW2323590.1 ATP-binding cassette domain-containing protein [Deltaproteobacteria bacterium]
MAEDILVLKDVVKSYNGQRVLDGISLVVKEGEHVSLIGESTTGKTTLFKVIVGLVPPDSGQVIIFGHDITRMNEFQKRNLLKNIEMQFQSGALFDSMTVRENIRFILDEETHLSGKEKETIIEQLLRGVSLWNASENFPYELSGGMQKRVAVARALSTSPRLALFDEPAAGLDPVTSARIIKVIKALVAEHRMTIIVATTNVLMAQQFAERFVILKNGRVHTDGPWPELLAKGDEYTKKFLSRDLMR